MTIYPINKRFLIVDNGERPTTGYPTNSILYDTIDKKFYQWNGSSWIESTGGSGATTLDALTDVDTTTVAPSNNDVLTWNSTDNEWVPAAPPGASGGEANTYSSTGTGEGIITKTKTGVDLPFKSLKQGTNITLTNNADDVTITSSGEANTSSNVGTGEGTLAKTKVGTDLPFKSLKQGTNITLTNNTNDVTITSAYPPDASTTVKGIAELATSAETTAGLVVQASDTRLSDARTPTSHAHAGEDITSGTVPAAQLPNATNSVKGAVITSNPNGSESAGTKVVLDSDTRMTNARTPTAHNHSGADITSGTVGPTVGGTGKTTFTQHALLKGGAGNTYTEVPVGTEGHVLKVVSGTPAWAAESGGGGGAPTDAQYITLATNATLSAERVLTAGTNISINDAGANGAATLNVPNASESVKGAVELATSSETTAGLAVQASDTRIVRDLYEEMKTRTIVGELDLQDANWGSGMFTRNTIIGNSAGWSSGTLGINRYYGTGGTANTKTGGITQTNNWQRKFKPHFFCIFALENNTNNQAAYIGLSSSTAAAELSNTAPLANLSGIGMVAITGQTNWQLYWNAGGATPNTADTGIARNSTAIRSIEIKNPNNDSNWYVNINEGTYTNTLTTNVPAESTAMVATWHSMNIDTTNSFIDIYKLIGKLIIV